MLDGERAAERLQTVEEPRVGVPGVVSGTALRVRGVLEPDLDIAHLLVDRLKRNVRRQVMDPLLPVWQLAGFEYAGVLVERVDRLAHHLFAALEKPVRPAVDIDKTVDPHLRLHALWDLERVELDRMEERVAQAVEAETLRLYEPGEGSPVALGVHANDAHALAGVLTPDLRKLCDETHGCHGLSGPGRAGEIPVHELTLVDSEVEGGHVPILHSEPLPRHDLAHKDLAAHHGRDRELGHIVDVREHAALGDTGQMRVGNVFVGEQNRSVPVALKPGHGLSGHVAAEAGEPVQQMLLLLPRQVQHLQGLRHGVLVVPRGLGDSLGD